MPVVVKWLWSISEAFCGLGKFWTFLLCNMFNNQKHVAVSLGEDVVRGNFCLIPWGQRTLAIGCKLLSKVSHFSKISYKNQKLNKKEGKKSQHNKRQVAASDPNEPNSVSKTETNIPQKQVYPPDEWFLLLYKELNNIYIYIYIYHFATWTYLTKNLDT